MLVRMKSQRKDLVVATRRISLLSLMAALVVCVLLAPSVLAQERTGSGGTVAEEIVVPPAPQPIPSSHISSQAEQTTIRVRAMRDHLEVDPDIEKLEQEIPAAVEKYDRLIKNTESRLSGGISTRHLEDFQRRWNRAEATVKQWRSQLGQRSNLLERDLETLSELREIWQVTLAAVTETEAQAAVLEVIQKTLQLIKEYEEQMGQRRDPLLRVQSQVFHLIEVIEEAHQQVDTAETRLVERLTEFDSPPLWSTVLHPTETQPADEQLRAVRRQNIADLREFFSTRRSWLTVFGIFFLAGIAVIVALNRRLKRLQTGDLEGEVAARVLSRPVSSSLLVTLVLLMVSFPNSPKIVNEIASIVVIVPLLRLFPGRVFAKVRLLLIAVVALHLLSRFVDLLPTVSLMRRFFYLGITVVAFAVSYRTLQRTSVATVVVSIWRRLARNAVKTYLVLLGTAFVANVLGNVSLSDVVVSAVIRSAYFALVLFTFYLIVESVLSIGMGTGAARKIRMVRRHEVLVRERLLTVFRLILVAAWVGWSLHFLRLLNPI
ncbi:MAG: hypothetical protein KAJ37_10115, partial [Candidatus Krumholzibacteria bacterium]|nr:hypothetical protein [Candidatus Krumholzibacteria bacterium]